MAKASCTSPKNKKMIDEDDDKLLLSKKQEQEKKDEWSADTKLLVTMGTFVSCFVGTMYAYSGLSDDYAKYLGEEIGKNAGCGDFFTNPIHDVADPSDLQKSLYLDSKGKQIDAKAVWGDSLAKAGIIGFFGQYFALLPGWIFDKFGVVTTATYGASLIFTGFCMFGLLTLKYPALVEMKGGSYLDAPFWLDPCVMFGACLALVGQGSKSLNFSMVLNVNKVLPEKDAPLWMGIYLSLDALSGVFFMIVAMILTDTYGYIPALGPWTFPYFFMFFGVLIGGVIGGSAIYVIKGVLARQKAAEEDEKVCTPRQSVKKGEEDQLDLDRFSGTPRQVLSGRVSGGGRGSLVDALATTPAGRNELASDAFENFEDTVKPRALDEEEKAFMPKEEEIATTPKMPTGMRKFLPLALLGFGVMFLGESQGLLFNKLSSKAIVYSRNDQQAMITVGTSEELFREAHDDLNLDYKCAAGAPVDKFHSKHCPGTNYNHVAASREWTAGDGDAFVLSKGFREAYEAAAQGAAVAPTACPANVQKMSWKPRADNPKIFEVTLDGHPQVKVEVKENDHIATWKKLAKELEKIDSKKKSIMNYKYTVSMTFMIFNGVGRFGGSAVVSATKGSTFFCESFYFVAGIFTYIVCFLWLTYCPNCSADLGTAAIHSAIIGTVFGSFFTIVPVYLKLMIAKTELGFWFGLMQFAMAVGQYFWNDLPGPVKYHYVSADDGIAGIGVFGKWWSYAIRFELVALVCALCLYVRQVMQRMKQNNKK